MPCVEGLRRTVGYTLAIIVLIFTGYALVGHHVPGGLRTREVHLEDLIIYLGLDTSALLGLAMIVGTTMSSPSCSLASSCYARGARISSTTSPWR